MRRGAVDAGWACRPQSGAALVGGSIGGAHKKLISGRSPDLPVNL